MPCKCFLSQYVKITTSLLSWAREIIVPYSDQFFFMILLLRMIDQHFIGCSQSLATTSVMVILPGVHSRRLQKHGNKNYIISDLYK